MANLITNPVLIRKDYTKWWKPGDKFMISSKADGRCVCVHHIHSNGPAVERPNGSKFWWVNGRLHRLNGPALEWADGSKEWCINGKRHRIDGPTVEWADGTKEWWVNNKLHRLDGPAIEYSKGRKEWWINGKLLPIKEVETWLKENKIDLKTIEGQLAFKLRWN